MGRGATDAAATMLDVSRSQQAGFPLRESVQLLHRTAPELALCLGPDSSKSFLKALWDARCGAPVPQTPLPTVYEPAETPRPYPSSAPRLICSLGEPRHGKDLTADYIVSQFEGARKIAFSDVFVREANEIFLADTPHRIDDSNKSHPAYRALLQELGVARRIQDPEYLLKRTRERLRELSEDPETSVVVITGPRADNDFDLIDRELGGELWQVVRPAIAGAPDAQHKIEAGVWRLDRSRVARVILNDREGDFTRVPAQIEEALSESP